MFLFVSFRFKSWKWLKNDIFVYLIILYCFLVLNSIFSYFFKFNDDFNSIFRSIVFLKFILLVFAFETLLQKMGGIKNLGKFIRILAEMKANGDYFVEETPFRVLGKLGLNEEDFYNGPESRILDDLAFGLMN